MSDTNKCNRERENMCTSARECSIRAVSLNRLYGTSCTSASSATQ